MSNYNGSPNYGQPFNYNGHFPTPLPPSQPQGSSYGTVQQPPYTQYRPPTSVQPPHTFHSTQFTNPYPYNTGSVYQNMGAPNNGSGPAHPPPPPLLPFSYPGYGPYTINGIPPAPFPPMPIPKNNIPMQRVDTSIAPPASSVVYFTPPGLPPKPVSAAISVEAQSAPVVFEDMVTVESEDREDGELSDSGRLGSQSSSLSNVSKEAKKNAAVQAENLPVHPNSSIQTPQSGLPTSLTGSPPKRKKPGSNSSTGSRNSSIQLSQNETLVIHKTAEIPHPFSINERHPSELNLVNDSGTTLDANRMQDTSLIRQTAPTQSSDHGMVGNRTSTVKSFATPITTKPDGLKSNDHSHHLREQVKVALLDLYQGDIGFHKLLAEGIDASLLKGLYDEIGIEVLNSASSSKEDHSFRRVEPDGPGFSPSRLLKRTESISTSTKPASSALLPSPSLTDLPSSVYAPSTSSIPHVTTGRSASLQHLAGTPKNSEPTQTAKLQGKNETQSAPSVTSKSDRTLERKDYIAKMLAAKAGKASTARTLKPTELPKATEFTQTSYDKQESALSIEASTASSLGTSASSVNQAELEAKRNASTELARRKMEALRTRSNESRGVIPQSLNTQSQQPRPTTIEAPIASLIMPSHPPQTLIVEQEVNVPTSTPQQYTPATPFFASLEVKQTLGLPGLSVIHPLTDLPISPQNSLSKPTGMVYHNSSPVSTYESQIVEKVGNITSNALLPPGDQSARPVRDTTTGTIKISSSDTTANSTSRKRATAADFIDTPTDGIKRRAGSNGRIQVIIDVSEDEGLVDDNDMEIDRGLSPALPEKYLHEKISIEKSRSTRELPPLTNFPSRSAAQVASSNSTPPLVQTPGKISELEELARAEEKIRLLKRMIAEREVKQKAKQSSSQVQSPGLISSTFPKTSITRGSSPTTSSNGSRTIEHRQQALAAENEGLEVQKKILVTAETVALGDLEAEEKVHAILTARAEEEGQAAVKATTTTERQYRARRKVALEAALPELDAQIDKARHELDDLRRQKEELEAEILRGSEGRKKILEELDILLRALEFEQVGEENTVQLDATNDIIRSENTQQVVTDSRTRGSSSLSRVSTYSLLDADKLSNELATVDQRFVSRHESVEQIMDISSTTSDEPQLMKYTMSISPSQQEQTGSEDGDDEYEPRFDNELLSQATPERHGGDQVSDRTHEPSPPQEADASPSFQGEVNQDVEVPVVELSSQEDGEVSHGLHVVGDADDGSDDYEPPEPPEPYTPVDNKVASEEHDHLVTNSSNQQANYHGQGQNSPQLPVVVSALPAIIDHSVNSDSEPAEVIQDNAQQNIRTLKPGHFTPYESPLKIFSSYRYHPEYVSGVSEGFRSLAYSHKINPNEPLCRWELAGGTCNDGSCKYQHFRNMRLTDDMILVQLGSTQGDAIQDKTAYINGLKQIIQDMRGRRVTDFDTVAKEITAYRASFIGDSSRVLNL